MSSQGTVAQRHLELKQHRSDEEADAHDDARERSDMVGMAVGDDDERGLELERLQITLGLHDIALILHPRKMREHDGNQDRDNHHYCGCFSCFFPVNAPYARL